MSGIEAGPEAKTPEVRIEIVEVAQLFVGDEKVASKPLPGSRTTDVPHLEQGYPGVSETLIDSGYSTVLRRRGTARENNLRVPSAKILIGGFGILLNTLVEVSDSPLSNTDHARSILLGTVGVLAFYSGAKDTYRAIRGRTPEIRHYTGLRDQLATLRQTGETS